MAEAEAVPATPEPTAGHPPDERARPPRRRVSARMRILGWSVGLLAAALFATTEAVYVVLHHRADATIKQEVAHEIVEFGSEKPAESATGTGPVAARLREGTRRAVPHSDIVLVGLLNGRILSVSGDTTAGALATQGAQWSRLAAVTKQTSGTLELPAGPASYTAVPVRAPGDPARGAFVAAVLNGPEHATVSRVTRLQLEVGLASLALASVLAWLMAGRVLRPVRATTDLARTITDANLADRLPVTGNDEVSHMAATFNAMLDRLQNAFAAQRRFLADAGHELRTPITIVQGNLDTMTATDPEDAETLALVADELLRMSRLVDELSLLAASEQPDFLRPVRTDLAEFGASLAAKAEALSAREWTVRSTLSGWAVLDAQRVTQAVMQLAANAVAHTDSGVALELVMSATARELAFAVIDHGEGVPVADRSRIFERFVRRDERHDRSTGLGLSIVAAIAEAHAGAVRLVDTPGGGATFTLAIPLVPVATPQPGRQLHPIGSP